MATSFTRRNAALALAFSVSIVSLNAQTLFFSWGDQFGGTGFDYATAVTVDNLGNQYTTGSFRNTVDFDPGTGTSNLTAAGAEDIFVMKTDVNGSLVWAVGIGGSGGDIGNEICVDANGFVYVAGEFESTVDFDPGSGTANLSSPSGTASFLLRLTAAGAYDWAITIGSTQGSTATGLTVDASGVSHLAGTFTGNVDLDPGSGTQLEVTIGQTDFYLMELDAAGAMQWAFAFGGSSLDRVEALAQDVNGDLFMTGFFMGTSDLETGNGTTNLTAIGGTDIFFAKYNGSNGNMMWAERIGGSGADGGTDIVTGFTGNVYATGYFEGSVDFDPGTGSTIFTAGTGISDAFVISLSTSGNLFWAGQMGGSSVDAGHAICVDVNDNVYTTGRFSGTADFDPSTTSNTQTSSGTYDVYMSKLSSTGTYVWAHHIGGASNDVGNGIAVDANNSVFCTGYFAGSADMDPQASTWSVTSNGQDDMMLVKYSQSGVGINEQTSNVFVEVFPNPSQGPVTIKVEGVDGPKLVRLVSLTGEVLSEQMMSGPTLLIDMSPFAEGIYFIEVTTDTEVIFEPILR